MTEDQRRELEELLLARATEGLSEADGARLDVLLAQAGDAYDSEWADRLVGELDAAWSEDSETGALSADLATAIVAQAPESLRSADAPTLRLVRADAGTGEARPSASAVDVPGRRMRVGGWVGWAAAAVLALAWMGTGRSAPVEGPPTFQQLAASEGALVRPWSATEDPTAEGASGEVVWVDALQQGVMRFSGLAPNDPTEFQYQLWIFDAERDERYPVDGGVFDVPAAGVVDVPIRARLPVGEVTLFAVTVEPPGGVVVSTRERIALVAQAEE